MNNLLYLADGSNVLAQHSKLTGELRLYAWRAASGHVAAPPTTPPERLCITAAIRVTDHLRAGSLVSYGTDLANAYYGT